MTGLVIQLTEMLLWMQHRKVCQVALNDYTPDEIGCAVNDHNYPPEGFL